MKGCWELVQHPTGRANQTCLASRTYRVWKHPPKKILRAARVPPARWKQRSRQEQTAALADLQAELFYLREGFRAASRVSKAFTQAHDAFLDGLNQKPGY